MWFSVVTFRFRFLHVLVDRMPSAIYNPQFHSPTLPTFTQQYTADSSTLPTPTHKKSRAYPPYNYQMDSAAFWSKLNLQPGAPPAVQNPKLAVPPRPTAPKPTAPKPTAPKLTAPKLAVSKPTTPKSPRSPADELSRPEGFKEPVVRFQDGMTPVPVSRATIHSVMLIGK